MPQASVLFLTLLATLLATALAPPSPGNELPWKLDRSYKYLWFHKEQKVGESLLKFKKVEGVKDMRYDLTSHRSYQRGGNRQAVESKLTFKADGTPVYYEEQCRLSSILSQYRALQEVRVSFKGTTVTTTYVNNQNSDKAIRTERKVPSGTFLFATHALEQWAVFTMALKGSRQKTLNVFYPDSGNVLRVEFKQEAETEPLRVGTKEVKASCYRFDCKDAGYQGKVWLDLEGRLLRYESGPLRFSLAAVDG